MGSRHYVARFTFARWRNEYGCSEIKSILYIRKLKKVNNSYGRILSVVAKHLNFVLFLYTQLKNLVDKFQVRGFPHLTIVITLSKMGIQNDYANDVTLKFPTMVKQYLYAKTWFSQ